jgi:hypothetical protein
LLACGRDVFVRDNDQGIRRQFGAIRLGKSHFMTHLPEEAHLVHEVSIWTRRQVPELWACSHYLGYIRSPVHSAITGQHGRGMSVYENGASAGKGVDGRDRQQGERILDHDSGTG